MKTSPSGFACGVCALAGYVFFCDRCGEFFCPRHLKCRHRPRDRDVSEVTDNDVQQAVRRMEMSGIDTVLDWFRRVQDYGSMPTDVSSIIQDHIVRFSLEVVLLAYGDFFEDEQRYIRFAGIVQFIATLLEP